MSRSVAAPKPVALVNIQAQYPNNSGAVRRSLANLTLDSLIQIILDLNERSDDLERELAQLKATGYSDYGG